VQVPGRTGEVRQSGTGFSISKDVEEVVLHATVVDDKQRLVTNLVQQARRLADRTAFFLGGRCIEIAPTEELFLGNAQDPRTRDYLEGRFG